VAYTVQLNNKAKKELTDLPRDTQLRIWDKIVALADNPRPDGCKKLKGTQDTYRIRIGSYRVLYEVYDKKLLVIVVKISTRGGAYK
jgi:mRNA interferase RelE/StbE